MDRRFHESGRSTERQRQEGDLLPLSSFEEKMKKELFDFLFFAQGQPLALVINPRVIVDGQGFPEAMLEVYKKAGAMKLDYDPEWPMEAFTDDKGVTAKLAFDGAVSVCFVQWEAVIQVRVGTGVTPRGWVGEAPEEAPEPPKKARGHLRLV